MSIKISSATERALDRVKKGETLRAAAKAEGIGGSTIYKAVARYLPDRVQSMPKRKKASNKVDGAKDFRPKFCPTCCKTKAPSQFYRDSSRPGGLQSACISCKSSTDRLKISSSKRQIIKSADCRWGHALAGDNLRMLKDGARYCVMCGLYRAAHGIEARLEEKRQRDPDSIEPKKAEVVLGTSPEHAQWLRDYGFKPKIPMYQW